MSHVLRRLGPALLALLIPAAGPLGAAPQKTPPPAPPAPPAAPAPPVHVHEGDLDVEIEGDGPSFVTVVRGSGRWVGLRLIDLTPELRQLYTGSRDAGVLVSAVEADTPAAKAGLLVGDVVVKVDGQAVSRSSDISRAVRRKEAGGKVAFEIRREKAAKTFEVTVAERKTERHAVRMHGFGPGFPFAGTEWDAHAAERVEEALERVRERLRDLEAKLKDLEKRFGGR